MFFQMPALAFAILQGAESWRPAPGVNTAAPQPEGQRALARADQVLKGPVAHAACWMLRAEYWVLHAGCCSRARTCARIPDGPRGLLWSPLRPGLRLPAPSCRAPKSVSRGDATALSPSPLPGPAKDNANVQLCALQVAREQLQRTGRSHFLGGFAKKFPLVVSSPCWSIIAIPHPPPPPSFLYGLDFPGRADTKRTVLLTWPHLCGRGGDVGKH